MYLSFICFYLELDLKLGDLRAQRQPIQPIALGLVVEVPKDRRDDDGGDVYGQVLPDFGEGRGAAHACGLLRCVLGGGGKKVRQRTMGQLT